MTAPATTSWTLVGPNSEKYYLVGPHSQRKVLEIVLGVFVGSALHGHHFSIREVVCVIFGDFLFEVMHSFITVSFI